MLFGLSISQASADQATLDAIEAAGVELTQEQLEAFPKNNCKITKEMIEKDEIPEGCQSLVDAVAALIADFSANDAAVEAIIRAASGVHPDLTQAFGDAAITTAPGQVALIAGLMVELAPTAAGDPGTLQAGFTPATPGLAGGGGSSSPN